MRSILPWLLLVTLGCAGLGSPPPTSVSIVASWEGAAAPGVERQLLEPLEAAVSRIEGVTRIDGRADGGRARIDLLLAGDDLGEVREAVASIQPMLPADADPPIVFRQMAGRRWLSVPLDRADDVAREIEQLPGVSQVVRHGAGVRTIQIRLDAARMADHPGAPTALGPDGPIGILEVRTDLPGIDHPDAAPLDAPVFVRPADLHSIRQAWPGATVLVDGDDAMLWGEHPGNPPGLDVWAPSGDVHEVLITGEDFEELAVVVEQVRAEIAAAGLASWTDLPPGRPEVTIEIDRTRAADLGVAIASIRDAIAVMSGGLEVGRSDDAEIRLQVEGSPSDPASVLLRAADGSLVPLSQVVVVSQSMTRSILHKDRRRAVTVQVDGEVPDLSGVQVPAGMAIELR